MSGPGVVVSSPQLTHEEIAEIAREIARAPYTRQKEQWFRNKYPDFACSNPALFEKCCEKNVDLQMLEFILAQFQLLQTNKDTATRNVMTKLTETYVVPHLEKLNNK